MSDKKRKAAFGALANYIGVKDAKALMAGADVHYEHGKFKAEEEEEPEEGEEEEEEGEEEEEEGEEEEEEGDEEEEDEEEDGEEAESFSTDDEDEEEEEDKKSSKKSKSGKGKTAKGKTAKGKPAKSSKKAKDEEEEEEDEPEDGWAAASYSDCLAEIKVYGGKQFLAKIASLSKEKKHAKMAATLDRLEAKYDKLEAKYDKKTIDAALKKYKVKTTAKNLEGKIAALTASQENFK